MSDNNKKPKKELPKFKPKLSKKAKQLEKAGAVKNTIPAGPIKSNTQSKKKGGPKGGSKPHGNKKQDQSALEHLFTDVVEQKPLNPQIAEAELKAKREEMLRKEMKAARQIADGSSSQPSESRGSTTKSKAKIKAEQIQRYQDRLSTVPTLPTRESIPKNVFPIADVDAPITLPLRPSTVNDPNVMTDDNDEPRSSHFCSTGAELLAKHNAILFQLPTKLAIGPAATTPPKIAKHAVNSVNNPVLIKSEHDGDRKVTVKSETKPLTDDNDELELLAPDDMPVDEKRVFIDANGRKRFNLGQTAGGERRATLLSLRAPEHAMSMAKYSQEELDEIKKRDQELLSATVAKTSTKSLLDNVKHNEWMGESCSGRIGTMKVYASGRLEMIINNQRLNVDLGVPPEYAMQMVRVSRVKPAKAEPTIEASSNNNDTATDMEQDNAVSSATNVVDLEVEKVKQEPVENKDAKVEPEVKVEEDEDVEYTFIPGCQVHETLVVTPNVKSLLKTMRQQELKYI